MRSDKYIELRVEPMVCFYQSRLPGYYRKVTVGTVILLVGALTGTFLAFLDADEWTAVATAVTSGVTAWMAFTGTKGKISRCAYACSRCRLDCPADYSAMSDSNTVDKVLEKVLWWRSLSPVDRASGTNQQLLVTTCEEFFERENEAWLSTSADKKPQEEAKDEDGSKQRSGDK